MVDEEPQIIIHGVRYESEAFKLQHLVMSQVRKILDDRGVNPESVEQALWLRAARPYTEDPSYCEMLLEDEVGKFDGDDWQGETSEQLTERLLVWLGEDELTNNNIRQTSEAIDSAMQRMDLADNDNVQMVLMRDKSIDPHRSEAYMSLVVYPPNPDDLSAPKKREISFPIALCHALASAALLDETLLAKLADKKKNSIVQSQPEEVSLSGKEWTMRVFKVRSISDEELLQTTTTHGRTMGDRLVQAGVKFIDRLAGRKGEHIDPISAYTDQEYALQYALASHRGSRRGY